MKVVFAFDSFKGSLAADQACEIAAEAMSPKDIHIVLLPVADGGEGTTTALTKALDGKVINETTTGPLPKISAAAFFGWCENQRMAIVEMAAASGLTLLEKNDRNPLLTTTYGAGELILRAARNKPKQILLGVGGSATVDGGTGSARALGWRFLNKNGEAVPDGGGSLSSIATIVRPDSLKLPPIDVLCDVTNPLTGPNGAARTFGPQKGADDSMVAQLEDGLSHLASLVNAQLGVDIEHVPGGGSAGGLAAGSIAWMNARLVPGIERILDAVRFNEVCRDADWIVTGEGTLDAQSLNGKVVSGILNRAQQLEQRPRVAVFAGQVNLSEEKIAQAGIDYIDAITPDDMPLEIAFNNAPVLLRETIKKFSVIH